MEEHSTAPWTPLAKVFLMNVVINDHLSFSEFTRPLRGRFPSTRTFVFFKFWLSLTSLPFLAFSAILFTIYTTFHLALSLLCPVLLLRYFFLNTILSRVILLLQAGCLQNAMKLTNITISRQEAPSYSFLRSYICCRLTVAAILHCQHLTFTTIDTFYDFCHPTFSAIFPFPPSYICGHRM